jgi:hypothetical protein
MIVDASIILSACIPDERSTGSSTGVDSRTRDQNNRELRSVDSQVLAPIAGQENLVGIHLLT